MGQYYNGKKIGTCETMYYMRMDEAEILARCKASDDDGITFQSMLTDNATMFRFPFPQEDSKKGDLLGIADHSPSFDMPVPHDFDLNHADICVSNSHKDTGTHKINIFVPCPHSKEFKLKTSHGNHQQYISIKYNAMRYPLWEDEDGNTQQNANAKMVKSTLFECSRCGQLQRVSPEEMAIAVEYAREHFTRQYKLFAPCDLENSGLVEQMDRKLSLALQTLSRI